MHAALIFSIKGFFTCSVFFRFLSFGIKLNITDADHTNGNKLI